MRVLVLYYAFALILSWLYVDICEAIFRVLKIQKEKMLQNII
jgi:hypothetical protein